MKHDEEHNRDVLNEHAVFAGRNRSPTVQERLRPFTAVNKEACVKYINAFSSG